MTGGDVESIQREKVNMTVLENGKIIVRWALIELRVQSVSNTEYNQR